MRRYRKLISVTAAMAVLGSALLLAGCGDSGSKDGSDGDSQKGDTAVSGEGWELADSIVKEVAEKMPSFGDYEVSIEDFGAEIKTSPITDKTEEAELAKKNTKAIADAIADVTGHKGGGTVQIPDGYTYTGAIHLDNNVNLHLSDGANVMFTTDYSQYPNVLTRWEGVVCYNYSPMVYAYQKENVAVTGKGVLDGQATVEEYWLPWKNKKFLPDETQDEDQKALRQMGEDGTDVEERVFGEGHYLRPCFLQTYECKNVLIEDITITNSPFWMVQPTFCEYVTVKGITVESHGYNNDGVNPDSCNMVVIDGCTFNTGDDCIAIKSGRDNDGRTIGKPCENVVAMNNTFITGKGACGTIGSEMSGGVKNIFFKDNESKDTVEHLQAISIKTNGDRGGTIENIYYKGIKAANVEDRAVLITMLYEEGDTEKTTPVIKNIYIEDCDITCQNPDNQQDTIGIFGYARSPIENVTFKNCSFTGADMELNLLNLKGLYFEGCKFNGESYPDGEYVPSADNFTVLGENVNSSTISLEYSSGAIEDDSMWKWEVADSADGPFTDAANVKDNEETLHNLGVSGGKIGIRAINPEKYYRLTVTIDGKDWVSDVYHYEEG